MLAAENDPAFGPVVYHESAVNVSAVKMAGICGDVGMIEKLSQGLTCQGHLASLRHGLMMS
jgi:hypothetical protein